MYTTACEMYCNRTERKKSINFWCIALQEYLRREVKPTTKDQLVNGISQFWATASVTKCRKYIQKVIPKIIEVNGEAAVF